MPDLAALRVLTLLGALGLAAQPPPHRSVHRPVTRRRFDVPPSRRRSSLPADPWEPVLTYVSRVRPGPLWPLPGRPAAR